MKIHTVVLLAVVSTLAFSTSAYADFAGGPRGLFGAGPGGFPGPGLMIEHMADHLDLDDTQRDSVRNILEAAKPELDALREQARGNRAALMALDSSDPAYSTELNNIAVCNGQLGREGALVLTRIRREGSADLTREQRGKLGRGRERRGQAEERRLQRR